MELNKLQRASVIAALVLFLVLVMMGNFTSAERGLKEQKPLVLVEKETNKPGFLVKMSNFLWQSDKTSYEPVWPEMEFGWKIVVGSIVGFFGAALGSVGGVGGGGIFVPMLTLIIGFDPKSSTAISKCMIMGAAGSTVYYNLRLRHPTLDMPLIDYDLALLFQPMLMLGISIGVAFNVMFADWMEAAKQLESESKPGDGEGQDYKPLPSGPAALTNDDEEVSLLQNIYWKELALLVYVWVGFLAVQIVKSYVKTCSITYWVLNALQGDSFQRKGSHKLEVSSDFALLFMWDSGWHGGWILGLGGGFILGPLFLELGIPPQVASATSTFSMVFSSSMSVVQYYLINRFPVPYAAYFVLIATIAALAGQHVVRKIIALLGRASIIIFILALTIFVSAISLGGVGIADMVEKLENEEYMGFQNLCYQ
ncbi:hypothetical protein GH714_034010 [Hevea brasiliensis]|uniref:Sulfite exporter TauE/SafE family protein n=1 Tax=Hevea brasiliensis TaxID=3981 RepID=A0A6A6LPC6_HEVBR|nr:hypothetical protein GH714_034010 [Hevea brasiliensis]